MVVRESRPVSAAANDAGRRRAQRNLKSEATAIGCETLRVAAEAVIDCTVDRAHKGLARYLRDHWCHGGLHLAQLDAIGRDTDGLR